MKMRDYLASLEREFAPHDVTIGEGDEARLPGELLCSMPAKELEARIVGEGSESGREFVQSERKEGLLFTRRITTRYWVDWNMAREGWAKSETGDKLHFYSAKAGHTQFTSACGRDYLPASRRLDRMQPGAKIACKSCLRAIGAA